MSGKFEFYEDRSGRWRWRLLAGNGCTVLRGEAFESKANVKKGIAAVQRAAQGAPITVVEW